jgi:hypothetical protein
MLGKTSSALVVFLVIVQFAAADGPPQTGPVVGSSVLLLRNGQVIEGHIVRNGDFYSVTGPDQEMQIHVASVEFLCRDLRDGYRRKKAAIQADDIQQHLQLLLWCERHGLLDCARQELDAAAAIDRDHPMIAVLSRRLKIESQPVAGQARPAEKVEPPPSDDQLDHMTRGMPPGTVESFVQVVQPILLNHYPGARGYALPDNKRLQLMRPALGETPGRRITQRNLYAVLQCIDWNNPGESQLLKAASGSSSGNAGSGFPAQYSTQYQKLAQWVYLVAQKPMPPDEGGAESVPFSELAAPELSPTHTRPSKHIPYMPSSIGHDKDGMNNKDNKEEVQAEPHAKPKTASAQSEGARAPRRMPADRAAAQAIDSVDPYDPAAFNNQADAPTEMPTPAARALHGGVQP